MSGAIDLVVRHLNGPGIDALTKTELQTELFGRSWQALAPILDGNARKYEEMAKKFGVILSPNSTK